MGDHLGDRVPLERVEVTEARKSLGVMISEDCTWKAEEARLSQASVLWQAHILAGHLSHSDVWRALVHTIMKTVKSPMVTTCLTKDRCKTIMRPFLSAGLSASGVCSKMQRAVVWGPLHCQGLGTHCLWTTQGVEHLLAMLQHPAHPTLTGQLLWTTMEEMQFKIGVSTSLLRCLHKACGPLVTRSWTAKTWQFLFDIKWKDPSDKPQLASPEDSFLMEQFLPVVTAERS
jgi:hypothetical protein